LGDPDICQLLGKQQKRRILRWDSSPNRFRVGGDNLYAEPRLTQCARFDAPIASCGATQDKQQAELTAATHNLVRMARLLAA
jgi:hypothetical protein